MSYLYQNLESWVIVERKEVHTREFFVFLKKMKNEK